MNFHHAAQDYLIYDLAVAANDCCSGPSGALDLECTAVRVTAYHRAREWELFPGFLLYAALAFWLSRLVVAPEKDPDSTASSGTRTSLRRSSRTATRISSRSAFFWTEQRCAGGGRGRLRLLPSSALRKWRSRA